MDYQEVVSSIGAPTHGSPGKGGKHQETSKYQLYRNKMDATSPFPASPLTSPDSHPAIPSPTPSPCEFVKTTSPSIFPVDSSSGLRNTPSPSIMTQTPEIPIARFRGLISTAGYTIQIPNQEMSNEISNSLF